MIPIYLDPSRAAVAVIGRSAAALRRVRWLREARAVVDLWSDAPSDELLTEGELKSRLPTRDDLAPYHAIWIVDLTPSEAAPLVQAARDAKVLVNVEDQIALCDFHTPAILRRGKLTLAVGTGGASPAAARAAREHLEAAFPVSWADALDEIADARARLRQRGAGFDELVEDARARLAQRGLA